MRYLIILYTVFMVACQSNQEHGHSHDGEGAHTHDNKQEEFKVADAAIDTLAERSDEIQITVPAKKGVEYKFFLNQYGKLEYEWSTASPLYFDFHGEPLDYEQTKYFESYVIGTLDKTKGMITMPFAGSHGWYWKNETDDDVVVTLTTKGKYRVIGLKQ